jgi:hypothetical protein
MTMAMSLHPPNPMSRPLNINVLLVVSSAIIEWHGQWLRNAKDVRIGIPMVPATSRRGAPKKLCMNIATIATQLEEESSASGTNRQAFNNFSAMFQPGTHPASLNGC